LNNLLVKYGFSHSTNTVGRTTTHHLKHMTSLLNVCCICGMVFGFINSPSFLIHVYMCAWVKIFTIPVMAYF